MQYGYSIVSTVSMDITISGLVMVTIKRLKTDLFGHLIPIDDAKPIICWLTTKPFAII